MGLFVVVLAFFSLYADSQAGFMISQEKIQIPFDLRLSWYGD